MPSRSKLTKPLIVTGRNDEEMAKALIQQAYQFKWELIVMRGGQKISLPEGTVIESNVSMGEAPTKGKPTTSDCASRINGRCA